MPAKVKVPRHARLVTVVQLSDLLGSFALERCDGAMNAASSDP